MIWFGLVSLVSGKPLVVSLSTAGNHAALSAVLRRLVLALQVVVGGRHDALDAAAALGVHAAPLGTRVLEPDLRTINQSNRWQQDAAVLSMEGQSGLDIG